MNKISEILEIEPYKIKFSLNDGRIRVLDIKPLIERHQHLEGIDKLLDIDVFKNVKIGALGEIFWDKIITTRYKGQEKLWDYDISPEFAIAESHEVVVSAL